MRDGRISLALLLWLAACTPPGAAPAAEAIAERPVAPLHHRRHRPPPRAAAPLPTPKSHAALRARLDLIEQQLRHLRDKLPAPP